MGAGIDGQRFAGGMSGGNCFWSARRVFGVSYGLAATCAGSRTVGVRTGGAGAIVPWECAAGDAGLRDRRGRACTAAA